MNIKKAVIFAAGFGTRFFPITKTIQKEMLPILDKPIIDYVVDDCIESGITEIVIVVSKRNDQIKKYYSEDNSVKRYLDKMNKLDKYEKISNIHNKAKFTFITQKETDLYGTAIPLLLAIDEVKNEDAFLAFTADDLLLSNDGISDTKKMIEYFKENNPDGMITCFTVEREKVPLYGIANFKENNGIKFLTDFLEKPTIEEVNSNYVAISKSIFKPSIFDHIKKIKPDNKTHEMYLTTAFTSLSKEKDVIIYETNSKYIDTGNVVNWLNANNELAKSKGLV